MSARDNIEKLVKSLRDLRERNRSVPIVVEGMKDVRALRSLGFDGEIIRLHSNSTMEEFSRNLSKDHEEVILLLDWDDKGKRLTSNLTRYLSTYGIRADYDFWKLCFSMVSQMSNVESLPSAFYRLVSENEASLRI